MEVFSVKVVVVLSIGTVVSVALPAETADADVEMTLAGDLPK